MPTLHGVGFEFAMEAVNPPGGSVSDAGSCAGWSIMSFFRDRPPIEEGLEDEHLMGTAEVVVFLKVFFQDYCRLLGLPR